MMMPYVQKSFARSYMLWFVITILLNSGCFAKNGEDKDKTSSNMYSNNESMGSPVLEKVIIYEQGRKRILASTSSEVKALADSLIAFSENADNVLRLAVDSKRIQSIQEESSALEILFSKAPVIVIKRNHRKISPLRLLIPLSGELAYEDYLTVFHGYPEYSAGPLRVKGKSKRFEMLLNAAKETD